MLTGQRPTFALDQDFLQTSFDGLPGCWCYFFNRSLAYERGQMPESVDAFLEQFERCAAVGLHEIVGNQQGQSSLGATSG